MPQAVWTPLAEAELEDIVYYIGVEEGRPLTAEKVARELHDRADYFAAHPHVGHQHRDFPEPWRYFVHKRWLVLYQPHGDSIEILRVVDASRDLPSLLK